MTTISPYSVAHLKHVRRPHWGRWLAAGLILLAFAAVVKAFVEGQIAWNVVAQFLSDLWRPEHWGSKERNGNDCQVHCAAQKSCPFAEIVFPFAIDRRDLKAALAIIEFVWPRSNIGCRAWRPTDG